jgi:hypothetical protein
MIHISEPVLKTDSGPASDFAEAVINQCGSFREGELYLFGKIKVRFFTFQRRLGADFLKPIQSKGNPGLHGVTRVQANGKRVDRGFEVVEEHSQAKIPS